MLSSTSLGGCFGCALRVGAGNADRLSSRKLLDSLQVLLTVQQSPAFYYQLSRFAAGRNLGQYFGLCFRCLHCSSSITSSQQVCLCLRIPICGCFQHTTLMQQARFFHQVESVLLLLQLGFYLVPSEPQSIHPAARSRAFKQTLSYLKSRNCLSETSIPHELLSPCLQICN